jgi:hypothetical protein
MVGLELQDGEVTLGKPAGWRRECQASMPRIDRGDEEDATKGGVIFEDSRDLGCRRTVDFYQSHCLRDWPPFSKDENRKIFGFYEDFSFRPENASDIIESSPTQRRGYVCIVE